MWCILSEISIQTIPDLRWYIFLQTHSDRLLSNIGALKQRILRTECLAQQVYWIYWRKVSKGQQWQDKTIDNIYLLPAPKAFGEMPVQDELFITKAFLQLK